MPENKHSNAHVCVDIETEKEKMAALYLEWLDRFTPTDDAMELAATREREDSKHPWIEADRYAFTEPDDWRAICELAGRDPDETQKVRIYIHKVIGE